MVTEPKALKEIHEIRERHYEETKNLKPSEIIRKVNDEGKEMLRIIEETRKNRAS